MKISVCVIGLNEEKRLADCLLSVKPIADEIVYVDSLSKDKSRTIAKQHGARVINQKFLGHVQQKNLAVAKAKHDWILSLDCDERLSADALRSILAEKERREDMEANLKVLNQLNTFEKSIKSENVRMVTHSIKNHLGTKNAFHGAQSYVGYANSIISIASSATDASKLTGFGATWASSLRSGLNSSIGMAITAGAALLPTALTSMEWFNAEQNKDEAHSINAALKKALELEEVIKICRQGRQDERINAAYEDPDLCSFLGQWVETAPPEPPALNRDYVDYFVENYEAIIDEMSNKLIQLSPGEFGISFLQDLARRPEVQGHEDAQALCKLFKLNPEQTPLEFKKAAQKAFQLGS